MQAARPTREHRPKSKVRAQILTPTTHSRLDRCRPNFLPYSLVVDSQVVVNKCSSTVSGVY